MEKIDLKDVSFLIPVRLEHSDRERNLRTCLSFLERHFDTNIIIGESDDHLRLRDLREKYKYFFTPYNNVFHKTKIVNGICGMAKTSMICIYDSDVFMPVEQFVSSAASIREGTLDVCIGYDGTCYNVPRQYESYFSKDLLKELPIHGFRKRRSNSCGGCVFFDREKFIEGGMMNEEFKSWGGEDDELIHRFSKLGYKVGKTDGILLHLDHHRGPDSRMGNRYYQGNKNELAKVGGMTREQLTEYVKTWTWTKGK